MTDRYRQLVTSPLGGRIADLLGLPQPSELRRHEPGRPVVGGPVLLGGSPGGRLGEPVAGVLDAVGADVRDTVPTDPDEGPGELLAALLFDATGITDSGQLEALRDFFRPGIRRLGRCGRGIVLGTPPEACEDPREATAQRALEGFTRSAAKEMRAGSTFQLVRVWPDAEAGLDSTLRFLLSGRSAYVSGQVVRVGPATDEAPSAPDDPERPLAGRVAVVTGAARGIGAAIAETLSRDGAEVVCLDLPAQGDRLAGVANRVGGTSLQLDITAEDAPERLAAFVDDRHGRVDVLVHNAGITRDRTIAGMTPEQWRQVLEVNLRSQERLTGRLLDDGLVGEDGRIVCVSSTSGIAGNRGQANYATSKAGVIGLVEALAPRLAGAGGTINAVAPGFIETEMTAAMPFGPRELGRRMNSLSQGGRPVDVAEAVAWLAAPGSRWINGRVVRVCGQSLVGA